MVVIIRFNNELNEIQSDFTSGQLHKLFRVAMTRAGPKVSHRENISEIFFHFSRENIKKYIFSVRSRKNIIFSKIFFQKPRKYFFGNCILSKTEKIFFNYFYILKKY